MYNISHNRLLSGAITLDILFSLGQICRHPANGMLNYVYGVSDNSKLVGKMITVFEGGNGEQVWREGAVTRLVTRRNKEA